jgi:hypothetical protein
MIGIKFGVDNKVWGPPQGKTEQECYSLPAFATTDSAWKVPCNIMCFQMSQEELNEVNKNGGKVYLKIINQGIAPLSMSPFKHEEITLMENFLSNQKYIKIIEEMFQLPSKTAREGYFSPFENKIKLDICDLLKFLVQQHSDDNFNQLFEEILTYTYAGFMDSIRNKDIKKNINENY